jgi:hypothetical protein
MRSHASTAALLTREALLAGCALASFGGCVEPRVITVASGIEIPATYSTRDPGSAQSGNSIGEVRFGHGLDGDGKVPPSFGASSFAVGDPIHLSLWRETDAPAGSMVRVSIRDAADRIVWSEDKQAPHGGSYLSFGIGRGLLRGRYRADVIVGRAVMSHQAFEVFAWKDRSTR